MKRLIALVLVVLMLGSTAALADSNARIDPFTTADNNNNTYHADGFVLNNDDGKGPQTELWLQVEASGQIDVTVPLVLVFKTNIDGGDATTADNYMITNNSRADLVVTDIKTATNNNKDDNPMSLVTFGDGAKPERDEYKVQLSVDKAKVVVGTDAAAVNGMWDLKTNAHHGSAVNGGLFELKKAELNDAKEMTGTPTVVTASMVTGELSFVTAMTGTGDSAAMDTTKGVQLLTVSYTVAIDTSDVGDIGNTITGGVDTKGMDFTHT